MANELVLEGGVWKFREGGGNNPTISISSLTFDDATLTQSFDLTNNGTTPASVELSFSSLSGGQTLLIGQGYDGGSGTSPTYVVDPDDDVRTITLGRGELLASSPSSSETITLTSNSGVTAEISCTVEPLSFFKDVLRSTLSPAVPSYECLFDSTANTGLIGGAFTASNYSLTASTTDYVGFQGYGVPTTSTGEVFINSSSSNWGKISGTTRTWLYAWTNTATLSPANQPFIWADDPYGIRNAGGQIHSYNPIRAIDGGTFTFNTNHSNCASDGTTITPSASENMVPTINSLTILACTWNGSNSVTYRWKQSGHGNGFSFGDIARSATTPFTWNYHIVGTRIGTGLKFRYAAVIDSDITNAQFLSLLDATGL